MRKRRWAALGGGAAVVVASFACATFDGAGVPPAADDGSAAEAAPPPIDATASVDAGSEAASICVPAPLEPSDAGVDANCEGTGLTVGLDTSSRHCGRCGHDCLGATCVNGLCTIEQLSTELGSTSVSAATATHLYYGTVGGGSRRVRRRSLATGASESLANPTGVGYVKDVRAVGPAPAVFAILSDRGVISVPVGGGSETTIVDDGNNTVDRLSVDETNLYWSRYGTLLARARADGTDAATNFAVFSATATRVATAFVADGTRLYYVVEETDGDGGKTHSIWMRGPAKADSVTQRLALVDEVVDFAFDEAFLYWSTSKGEIWRAAKTTAAPAELVARAPGPHLWSKGLAVDDAYVYAAMTLSGQGGDVQMTLVQAPKCGGPTRVVARDAIVGAGLVASGGYLFWGNNPSLQRLAK